jgi:hypothetical protein
LITNNPENLLKQLKEILKESELVSAKITFREILSNEFTVVWPIGENFFKIT